ncbi:unnamed protein product [Linum trigynum]|uniref:Uncharacterized protein n=1 Tax=Linum trigynum TaxID=586398 RepID=A0AAV2GMH4_9ROSI
MDEDKCGELTRGPCDDDGEDSVGRVGESGPVTLCMGEVIACSGEKLVLVATSTSSSSTRNGGTQWNSRGS